MPDAIQMRRQGNLLTDEDTHALDLVETCDPADAPS